MNETYKKWKLENPNYYKDYYEKNKEKLNLQHQDWVKKNLIEYKKYQRKYHKEYYRMQKIKKMEEKVNAFKESLVSTLEK